jgi:tetratricopeptide (TPR) repeat protein
MKKIAMSLIVCMLFAASPAWCEEAIDFYKLGLESSSFNKKIYYFTKAVELNPRLAIAFKKRGMIYYFQEKYSKMLLDFRRYTALTPSDPEGFGMIGLAQLKLGNFTEAITQLSRAIDMDPLLASAYLHRSEAYYHKGLFEQAVADSTEAISLGKAQSTIGKAYTVRSKAYRQLGQEDLADKDFNKAYLLDPANYSYRYFTITNYLASLASDSNYISFKDIRWLGLVGIIVLLLVLIFRLALPTPRKGGL